MLWHNGWMFRSPFFFVQKCFAVLCKHFQILIACFGRSPATASPKLKVETRYIYIWAESGNRDRPGPSVRIWSICKSISKMCNQGHAAFFCFVVVNIKAMLLVLFFYLTRMLLVLYVRLCISTHFNSTKNLKWDSQKASHLYIFSWFC